MFIQTSSCVSPLLHAEVRCRVPHNTALLKMRRRRGGGLEPGPALVNTTTTAPQHHHTNIVTNFQQSRSDPREERTQCRKTRGEAAVHTTRHTPPPHTTSVLINPAPISTMVTPLQALLYKPCHVLFIIASTINPSQLLIGFLDRK